MAEKSKKTAATWWDHYSLNFWLWACLDDADKYLRSINEFRTILKNCGHELSANDRIASYRIRIAAKNETELHKYDFAMTLGTALRYLDKLAPFFPEIAGPYKEANHVRKEGPHFRNMIEHAITNIEAAERGTPRGGFVRRSKAASSISGSGLGEADATATIVDEGGHWLGGRLNIEKAVEELQAIYEIIKVVPAPQPHPH